MFLEQIILALERQLCVDHEKGRVKKNVFRKEH